MPLVVEDGSGVPGAQTYGSAAEVATWLRDRGHGAFASLAEEPLAGETLSTQEQILTRATHRADALIAPWKTDGTRPVDPDQGLFLPRRYLRAGEPIDGVPRWWVEGISLLAEAFAVDHLAGASRESHWDPSVAAARGLRYRARRPGFFELYPEAGVLLRRMLR